MSDKPKPPTPTAAQFAPAGHRRQTPLSEAEVMFRMEKLLAKLPPKAGSRVLAWLCLKAADEQGGEFQITLKRLAGEPEKPAEVKS